MNKEEFVTEWNEQKIKPGEVIAIVGKEDPEIALLIGHMNGNIHKKYYTAIVISHRSKCYGLKIGIETSVKKLSGRIFEELNKYDIVQDFGEK